MSRVLPIHKFSQFTSSRSGQCHLFSQLRVFHVDTVEMFQIHGVEMVHILTVGMFHIHTVEIFHIRTVEMFHIRTVENVQYSQKWSDRFSERFWTKIGLFPGGPGSVPGRFWDNGKVFP